MSTKLTPLHDRIVIRRLPEAEMTAGGIYIPDNAREKPQVGTVIAAGPGRRTDKGERIPLDVKVGDEVLFGKYAGTEAPKRQYFEDAGEELVIMREEEILGIVEGAPKSKEREKEHAAKR